MSKKGKGMKEPAHVSRSSDYTIVALEHPVDVKRVNNNKYQLKFRGEVVATFRSVEGFDAYEAISKLVLVHQEPKWFCPECGSVMNIDDVVMYELWGDKFDSIYDEGWFPSAHLVLWCPKCNDKCDEDDDYPQYDGLGYQL